MLFGLTFGPNNAQPSTPRLPRRGNVEASLERLTGHECVSCMDPIHGVEVRAPCDHYYDKECVLALFTAALRDETLFPPRCCRKRIPVTLVQPHLSPEALSQFKSKVKELRVEKRVYCAKPSCSRFLGAQYEGVLPGLLAPNLKCPARGCGTYTCSWCKNEIKRGERHRCEESSADLRVLALGQEAGWVRCPGCEAMIELTMGCYHMTCRCKTQFCYLCRARWKTCQCPQWEERRLVAAAEERADVQIRLERGGRAPIRRRPPPRLRLADHVEPIRIADIPAVLRREADDAVDVPRAPDTPPSPRTPDATIHHVFEELVSVYLGSTAARGRNPLRVAQPAPTRLSIISNPFDDAHRASVALEDMDSLAGEIGTASSSVAPLRWNKQSPDERERRRALTVHWVERLRDHHACDHDKWTFHRGEGHCAVCEEHILICYFRCNACEMQICRKCRWNRT
ncbi:hypothetical protein C8Q80DRAFT_810441 [Daedaleopsis nitida]|nr:hypothetical protein C8Q80DRAFT_810441 [Daedaleopsis nitida]